jgi:drug/metabolite transporter (DMT)-like permease
MQDGFDIDNQRNTDAGWRRLAARGFGNAYVLLVLTMLFWGGNAVVARGAHELVPPLTLAWMRWTIATLIILPIAWPYLKRDYAVIRAHWPVIAFLGALGAGSFVSLFYIGLGKTTAINAIIINTSVSILIPIAVFFIYRETVTRIQAVGIALSFIGVLIVLTKGDLAVLTTLELNEGDLWVVAATLVWAIYTALLREQPKIHWLSFAALSFAMGSLVNLPLFISEALAGKHVQPTLEAFMAVAYVSTFPSVLAQIFYVRGVELIGSSRAGIFMHLVPLFGAILAILFLGEQLHLYHLGSFAFVATGVWLATRPKTLVKTPAS